LGKLLNGELVPCLKQKGMNNEDKPVP